MTRLPGVRFRFRSLLLPLMLFTLGAHLWAQDADEDDDDDSPRTNYASLSLRYDARGNADSTFFAYGDVQNLAGIEARLESVLHCQPGTLVHPPFDPTLPKYIASRPAKEQELYRQYSDRSRQRTLKGECRAAMTRTGLLLSTDIQLRELTGELKSDGVTRLSVMLSYPASSFSEHTPGIKLPWETQASDRPGQSEPISRANYSIDTSAPALSAIHLVFGLRGRDIVRQAVLPAIFLIAPILICLWMGRAALRDARVDATAAWFSYYRVLAWCGNGLVLIWMMGHTVRQGLEVIAAYYTAARTAGAVALEVGIMMLPPWAAFFVCILMSYRVYRQVREETWTRKEFFINQFLGIAGQFLPLACFLAAIEMIAVNGQASVALFAGAYISFAGCKWLAARYSGLHIEPLTRGELRDRVFEIAKKAAVEVRQVFIVPAGKSQMANAFASRNRMVMFTDYLLRRMNKREVSAIAAHEIAHIQKKHPAWQTAAFVGLMFSSQVMYGILVAIAGYLRHALQIRRAAEGASAASGLAAIVQVGDQILRFPELILILFVVALILYHLNSRHMEYVADAGAVQFTEDPEAMITSLLKLSRLNLTPVQWDRATGAMLTHPSTLKRVQRIARVGQVPPERLQQLLVESTNPNIQTEGQETWAHEEQFNVESAADAVVTLRSARGELQLKKWVLRLVVIGPAAAIAWASAHFHLQHRTALFSVGGLICIALYIAVGEWQGAWFRDRTKRRFMERLANEGVSVTGNEVRMVVLSPHPTPRAYAYGFSWDTGGLFLGDDELCFVGDQIRFALRREQVMSVRVGQGVPDWIAERRIYIEWQGVPGQAVQVWNLLPKDPIGIWQSRQQSAELAAALARWKSRSEPFSELPTGLLGLPCPEIGEITNQRLKAAVSFGRFLKVAMLSELLVLVVWIVLGLPSAWFACVLELLVCVYSFSPFWFYQEKDDSGVIRGEVFNAQPGD
ncbi:MAG: M48 family metalloprotease [Acidobacteria bacterium]|nr:M48 family metalloprotease [Acidobacteriota bacterium]